MLYNSFIFLLFFPFATLVYYLVPQRWKWAYLLAVSYWFYANWNAAALLLMIGITLVTYFGARWIDSDKCRHPRKVLLGTIVLTVLPLMMFKYLNFATASINGLLDMCGVRMAIPMTDWLLPIGISFYTFQAMGYVIDVYRKKSIGGGKKPYSCTNLGLYATFVAFFPQTSAGPIGRAHDLIPQFENPRGFNPRNVSVGLKWMLWGYFMKVAVADRLALYTDAVMGNVERHNGSSVLLAAILFSIQIYCDFGGYSLLAAGAGKAMGFDLIQNFQRPYMSQSVGEFWRRWHISLSTWFRDYIYFPLGGSRCSKLRTNINLLITFLVSGLWHGAAWTFVFWGGLNGMFQVFERPFVKKGKATQCGSLVKWLRIALTFTLMTVAWVFFKSNTFTNAFVAVCKMFIPSGSLYYSDISTLLYCLCGAGIVVAEDICHERIGRHPLLDNRQTWVRIVSIVAITMYIIAFGVFDGGQFIYFKF